MKVMVAIVELTVLLIPRVTLLPHQLLIVILTMVHQPQMVRLDKLS